MVELRPVVVFPGAHRRGGVERVVLEELRHLATRHPTTFVGCELDDSDPLGPIRHIVPTPPRWSIGAFRPAGFRAGAAECIPRDVGTVAVSHGVNAPPGHVYHVHSLHRSWLRAAQRARIRGITVPSAVRYLLPRHQVLLALEWDYFHKHRPRAVVAVSEELSHDIEELYGVDPELVRVIPNGFDPATYNPTRRTRLREERRSLAGVADTAVVVLLVANELHRKGLDVLLEAVARAGDERLEIHVVGRTPLHAFERRIEGLGLAGRVRYHGPTSDVAQYHAIADVLVLPTQYETFAMVVLEALASGLPVVVTAGTPGAGARVHHDVNGLLLQDATDPEELSALLVLALDASRRQRWARAAPATVADLHWDGLMARVEQLLKDSA